MTDELTEPELLSEISTAELLHDRQECYNELTVILIADKSGLKEYSGGSIVERAKRNLEMLEIIRKECLSRGLDPATYQEK